MKHFFLAIFYLALGHVWHSQQGYIKDLRVEASQTEMWELTARELLKVVEANKVEHAVFMAIVKCESDVRHDITGDNGKAYGIAQYWKPTFERHARQAGFKNVDYRNMADQSKVFVKGVKENYNEWACWGKVMTELVDVKMILTEKGWKE